MTRVKIKVAHRVSFSMRLRFGSCFNDVAQGTRKVEKTEGNEMKITVINPRKGTKKAQIQMMKHMVDPKARLRLKALLFLTPNLVDNFTAIILSFVIPNQNECIYSHKQSMLKVNSDPDPRTVHSRHKCEKYQREIYDYFW